MLIIYFDIILIEYWNCKSVTFILSYVIITEVVEWIVSNVRYSLVSDRDISITVDISITSE